MSERRAVLEEHKYAKGLAVIYFISLARRASAMQIANTTSVVFIFLNAHVGDSS